MPVATALIASMDPSALSRLSEPDMLVRIAVQVLLLGASAFFSSSEVALFSLSKMDLHQLRRQRHPQVARLYALLEQPRRLIISILCGNEFINVAAAANMAAILLALFDESQAALLNMAVMVPMLLLFGEVTPKTIAISDPVRLSSRIIAAPMTAWVRLVTPLRWAVRVAADRLTRPFVGEERSSENILVADEFRTLVKELEESGELCLEERVLIDSLLAAANTEVVQVMVPRTRMTFIPAGTPVREALERVRAQRQQRVPVFEGHRDNLLGFLHAEELMTRVVEGADLDALRLEDLLHPVVVAPPTKGLDEMLDFFREHQVLAAVILNEFGGVEGMVSVRNLVEIVCDPVCGASAAPESYAGPEPGSFDVPGEMKLSTFDDLTNFGIGDPRMTTVGGVVFRHLDRLPLVGDSDTVEGIGFTVLEMEEHRIVRLRAARGDAEDAPPAGSPSGPRDLRGAP